MSRVDFYMLSSSDVRSRWVMACRLVEKAYSQGSRVYLHARSEADSAALDDLLWTFRQGSFIPHARFGGLSVTDSHTPVWIGHGEGGQARGDVLINLGDSIPLGYEQYERILELIDQDENVRQLGRTRYRAYRAAGHQLFDHDLSRSG